MRTKFSTASPKARAITPGPIQVGSAWVAGRVGPAKGSQSRPVRSAAEECRADFSARMPFTRKPSSGRRTINPGRTGSHWAAACDAGPAEAATGTGPPAGARTLAREGGAHAGHHFSRLNLSTLTVS